MIRKVLFDCDDTLVASEALAFSACCAVVNETLSANGVSKKFTASELKERFVGKTFRSIVFELSGEYGFSVAEAELERLVLEEEDRVIAKLESEVEPTPGVSDVLSRLHGQHTLAVVSSSAIRRVKACLTKTGLDRFFPEGRIFSAASSPSCPTSKPNPAIYLHALKTLGGTADEYIAVEDSKSGVLAAVRAGIKVVGYIGAVAASERDERTRVLLENGACTVITDWEGLLPILNG